MILKYSPTYKITIDNVDLNFNEERLLVRTKLNREYEEENEIIQLGVGKKPIHQRRDIYKEKNTAESFYFLNYNVNDLLTEVEVHQCDHIEVLGFSFSFNDELDEIALKLSDHSEISIISEGEIYFKDLKMCICDNREKWEVRETLLPISIAHLTQHIWIN